MGSKNPSVLIAIWSSIAYKAVAVSLYRQRGTVISILFIEEKNEAQKTKYLAQSHTNSKCQSHPHPWHLFSLSVVGVSTSNRNAVPGQLLAVNQSHRKGPISSCRWL